MDEQTKYGVNSNPAGSEAPDETGKQLRSEVFNHILRSKVLIDRSQKLVAALRSIASDPR